MLTKRRRRNIIFLNVLIFSLCILLFGNADISLKLNHATPFILLSLLVAFSVFSKTSYSAVAGFISGAFVDSIANSSYCFNTLALMLLAVGASLLSDRVFNKNLKAVVALCFLTTAVYYIFYWLIFINPSVSTTDSIAYLLQFALPSSLYTTLFIFPFYFLYKHWDKLRNE